MQLTGLREIHTTSFAFCRERRLLYYFDQISCGWRSYEVTSILKSVLITGSSGLIGSDVALAFADQGYTVHGVDNNQRAIFFGPQGDTRWNQQRLSTLVRDFTHHEL